MKLPVTAIILTYNEEKNIRGCIESVIELVDQVLVVDSFSNDSTLQLLDQYPVQVLQRPFLNYGHQRNWAMQSGLIRNEWLLHLDADHRITTRLGLELKRKFTAPIPKGVNGFLVSRRTMFMGKWIRFGGHYPTYHAILFRKGLGVCEWRLYDQHFKVDGKMEQLQGDVLDLITESLQTFINRHNRWSDLECEEQFAASPQRTENLIAGKITGGPIQRRRYLKNMYHRFPLFLRPLIYFLVRYFLRLGFLDGRRGLIFHFLQCFWFRFLIDAKLYELRMKAKSGVLTAASRFSKIPV